jgi:Tfp pilus assembly protein PilX
MKSNEKQMKKKQFKQGGVSIFLVVAACLLVSVIVASFIRLVIRDQQQASAQDLSQSAYDSSQAGVEDAKRFLNWYTNNCGTRKTTSTATQCEKVAAELNKSNQDQSCNLLGLAGIGSAEGETIVQTSTSSNDADLNQAYTCVKMETQTDDFLGEVSEGGMKVVPLKSQSVFNTVKIQWFMRSDLGNTDDLNIDLNNTDFKDGVYTFPKNDKKTWTTNHPAVLHTQFISFVNGGNLESLDGQFKGTENGASSLVLYPSKIGTSTSLAIDGRTRSGGNNAVPVKCEKSLDSVSYACSATVSLGTSVPSSTQAYLVLRTFYNQSNFSVSLYNDNTLVKFDGVQPEVDSTGRANDRFRRIKSRIEMTNNQFPIPDFAVELSGEGSQLLCKDFQVSQIRQNFSCE